MNKERFEKIKENVYTRCDIANATGIGLTSPDKEELELINEIDRLNNIIDELAEWLEKTYQDEALNKLKELKGDN